MIDVNKIIAFESGELEDTEVVELFSKLIADGTAWSLQGSYGRQAGAFIEAGFIDPQGNIDWDVVNDNLT